MCLKIKKKIVFKLAVVCLIPMPCYFFNVTHSLTWRKSLKVPGIYRRRGNSHQSKWDPDHVCVPLKVWVCKIIRCICMRCWQASLGGEETQETLQLFNFWNPFLHRSYWSCLCKFLELHPHKTTKWALSAEKGYFEYISQKTSPFEKQT